MSSPSSKARLNEVIPDAQYLGQKYDVFVEGAVSPSQEDQERAIEQQMAEISRNQEFARRTESLITALDEKNRQLEEMAVLVESITPLPGMDPEKYLTLMADPENAPDFRDGKIVSLAKKSRNLTEALRKEKNKSAKLSRENDALEKRLAQAEEDRVDALAIAGRTTQSVAKEKEREQHGDNLDVESMEQTIRKMKKEQNQATKTIDELRRKLHESNQKMKSLERALSKEVGDGIAINDAIAVDSGWRGRAQQIVMLKNKCKRLENENNSYKLGNMTIGGSNTNMGSGMVMSSGMTPHSGAGVPLGIRTNTDTGGLTYTNDDGLSTLADTVITTSSNYASGRTVRTDVDTKAEKLIKDMTAERTEAIETLTAQHSKLQNQNDYMKKKIIARDARIKALESDVGRQRDSLKVMVTKADSDSQLVSALQKEVGRLRSELQQSMIEVRKSQSPTRIKMAKTGTVSGKIDDPEIARLRRLVKQQSEQIETQNDMLRELRGGIYRK